MSVVVVRSKYYCIPVLLSMSVVVVRSKYYFGDARVYVLALSVDVLWAEEPLQGSAHEVANCAVLLVFCLRRKNSRHLLRVSLAVKLRLLSTDREREKLLPRLQLLHNHASCRDHGEPSVLQLLRLHRLQLLRIRRLQPKRIETEVAALIVSLNGPRLPLRRRIASRVISTDRLEGEDRKDLGNRDRDHHNWPERLQRGLLEREVSRHVDVAAEERVEVLANHEAESSEHPDTPMLQFDLAVELDLALRDVVRRAEAQRIEKAKGTGYARKRLRIFNAIERLWRCRCFLLLLASYREHEKLLPRLQLLHNHASCRDHGEPPVLQLLRLHRLQLLRIRRLQPERIEAQVAALIVSLNGPRLPLRRRIASRVISTDRLEGEDRKDLGNRDRDHHNWPERLQRGLLEREVSRHIDVAAEERVEVLANHEAERSEHPDT